MRGSHESGSFDPPTNESEEPTQHPTKEKTDMTNPKSNGRIGRPAGAPDGQKDVTANQRLIGGKQRVTVPLLQDEAMTVELETVRTSAFSMGEHFYAVQRGIAEIYADDIIAVADSLQWPVTIQDVGERLLERFGIAIDDGDTFESYIPVAFTGSDRSQCPIKALAVPVKEALLAMAHHAGRFVAITARRSELEQALSGDIDEGTKQIVLGALHWLDTNAALDAPQPESNAGMRKPT